jgi:3-oxoacyl-[acyl-carrier protein] reductase
MRNLREVARHIEADGCVSLVLDLDLATPAAADTIVKTTTDRFGRIDALIIVAGAVPGLDLFKMSDEQWNTGLALKFHGARRLTISAWDALKASQGAAIFTSGNAATMPKASSAAVGAINAAIEAMAKAFADRGIEDGIHVNCVSPGAVLTERRLALIEKVAAAQQIDMEKAKADFLTRAGIRRFGTPEELPDLVAFAVSPAARWMSGTVLRMDGGEIRTVRGDHSARAGSGSS